jgi:hypothetical protein
MKFNKLFKSSYVKAADLNGRQRKLTITSVGVEAVGRDQEEKPVVRFEEIEQAMVLNRINGETLCEAYGDDTDNWEGRKVVLFPSKTEYAGKRVDCVRIMVPKDEPSKAAEAPEGFPCEDNLEV